MNIRRILALAGVFLILLLYGASLVLGIIGSPKALDLLLAALFCTMVVPAMIYGCGVLLKNSGPFRKGQPLKVAGNDRKRLQKGRPGGENESSLSGGFFTMQTLLSGRPGWKCLLSHNNLVSSRSVGYHSNRNLDFLLNRLDVSAAVLRQILVILDSADIALPSRQSLVYRLCLL